MSTTSPIRLFNSTEKSVAYRFMFGDKTFTDMRIDDVTGTLSANQCKDVTLLLLDDIQHRIWAYFVIFEALYIHDTKDHPTTSVEHDITFATQSGLTTTAVTVINTEDNEKGSETLLLIHCESSFGSNSHEKVEIDFPTMSIREVCACVLFENASANPIAVKIRRRKPICVSEKYLVLLPNQSRRVHISIFPFHDPGRFYWISIASVILKGTEPFSKPKKAWKESLKKSGRLIVAINTLMSINYYSLGNGPAEATLEFAQSQVFSWGRSRSTIPSLQEQSTLGVNYQPSKVKINPVAMNRTAKGHFKFVNSTKEIVVYRIKCIKNAFGSWLRIEPEPVGKLEPGEEKYFELLVYSGYAPSPELRITIEIAYLEQHDDHPNKCKFMNEDWIRLITKVNRVSNDATLTIKIHDNPKKKLAQAYAELVSIFPAEPQFLDSKPDKASARKRTTRKKNDDKNS